MLTFARTSPTSCKVTLAELPLKTGLMGENHYSAPSDRFPVAPADFHESEAEERCPYPIASREILNHMTVVMASPRVHVWTDHP
jgi:hypothetical protein